MKRIAVVFALLCAALSSLAFAQTPEADEAIPPEVQQFLDSLRPLQGEIPLPDAQASLDLEKNYVFYDANDAKAILVDLWGNPPDTVSDVMGLVMPAGTTPWSDSWGAVITFEDTGYVSDDDAADINYRELMEQLQEGARQNNEARREAGYPTVDVVGWAEVPRYDPESHSVIWAQDLDFSDSDVNTLNYDFRSLGRYGVLSMNLVSTTPELDDVRQAARDFAQHVEFNAGARYEDFNASTDRVAEYGLGGLVAAGVGVAAAKKFGLLAILAKFLKPILIGIVILIGVLWRRIKNLFGMGGEEEAVDPEWEAYAYGDDEPEAPEGPTNAVPPPVNEGSKDRPA